MATSVKLVDTLYTQESPFIFHGTVRAREPQKKTIYSGDYSQCNEAVLLEKRKKRGLEKFRETLDY